MPFTFKQLNLSGVYLIDSKKFADFRGEFLEMFKASEFITAGMNVEFKQDNFSKSQKGVLRGLHFQLPPKAQGKLVRAVQGKIFDVAVDMRKSSPTFKQWLSVELSAENALALYVPPGFAHGFLSLTDDTLVLYKTTEEYAADLERGVRWNDPELAIAWPLPKPLLAERDAKFPLLKDAEYV